MAIIKRRRVFAVGGLVEDNPLASGATTLTSAGLVALPTLLTDEYFPIVLDPDGIAGAPEVAYLTSHAAGTTTATISKAGYEGTTARAHDRDTPWAHTTTHMDFDGQDGGSGLIGVKQYTPGSDTTIATTTSATSVDADATNLIVSFVAPPSGIVLVRLSCVTSVSTGVSALWVLRDGSGEVSGTKGIAIGNAITVRISYPCRVTGLTPGTTYTWKWGIQSAGGATFNLWGGPTYGPATMEVWAVNL